MFMTSVPSASLITRMLVPDSLEYATGAQRLATLGRFDLPIGEQILPSRYPPTFSALLAPAYLVRPADIFAGIWACRIYWATGCAALAFALARRIGATAALLVAVAVSAHPVVLNSASMILSDAPCLAGLLALIAIRAACPTPGPRAFVAAGVALAFAVACRSLSGAYALPFALLLVRRRPGRILSAIALLAPAFAVIAINAIYNRLRFGSFDMNGYVYWCAMPYSQFDYVFHPQYFRHEFNSLLRDPWFTYPAMVSVSAAFVLRRVWRALWNDVVVPTWLAVVPLTALYLFYFYRDERLFLPILLGAFLPGVLAIAAYLGRSSPGRGVAVIATIALAFRTSGSITTMAGPLPVNELLTQLHAHLPSRCGLITMLDPLTIDAFVTHGTERRWIPATREQEYADKVIADRRLDLWGIPRPPPLFHREPTLLVQGARLAIPETAEDDALLDRLADPAGPPVFVDVATINLLPELRPRLAKRFTAKFVDGAPAIIECVPRVAASSQPAVTR